YPPMERLLLRRARQVHRVPRRPASPPPGIPATAPRRRRGPRQEVLRPRRPDHVTARRHHVPPLVHLPHLHPRRPAPARRIRRRDPPHDPAPDRRRHLPARRPRHHRPRPVEPHPHPRRQLRRHPHEPHVRRIV